MVCDASYDRMQQFEVVHETLISQKSRDEILESDFRPSLNSPKCQNMVLQADNGRPHRARIINEYKNLQNIASIQLPSLSTDLNPIEHLWD